MKEKEKTRIRALYRGSLPQKKLVWKLNAEGNTAKNIASQVAPPVAESTIYTWVREFRRLLPSALLGFYEEDGLPDLIADKWREYNARSPEKIEEFNKLRKQKEKERPTAEVTWAAEFARYLRGRIVLPNPTEFLPLELSNGEQYFENSAGARGCFSWHTTQDGRVEIRLSDHLKDVFIEDDPSFEKFLELRPDVRMMLDEFKKNAAIYVSAAHILLTCISSEGKGLIGDLIRQEFNEADGPIEGCLSGSKYAVLVYSVQEGDNDTPQLLEVLGGFFISAYKKVIYDVGNWQLRRADYSCVDSGDVTTLKFAHFNLARGGKSGISHLVKVHQQLISEYSGPTKQLTQAVIDGYDQADKDRDQLLFNL